MSKTNNFDAFYDVVVKMVNDLNEKELKVRKLRNIALMVKEDLDKQIQEFFSLSRKINLLKLKHMRAHNNQTTFSTKEQKDLALHEGKIRNLSLRIKANKDILKNAQRKINEVDQLEKKVKSMVSMLQGRKKEIFKSLSQIEKMKGRKCELPSYKKEGETLKIASRYAHSYSTLLEGLVEINKTLAFITHAAKKEKPTVTIDWQVVNTLSNKEKADYFLNLLLKIKKAPKVNTIKVSVGNLVESINKIDEDIFRQCFYEFNKAKQAYLKENSKPTVTIDWQKVNTLSNKEKADYFLNLLLKIKKAPKVNTIKVSVGNLVESINKADEKVFYQCFSEFNKAKEAYLKENSKPTVTIDWQKVNTLSNKEKADYFLNLLLKIKKAPKVDTIEVSVGNLVENINKADEKVFYQCFSEFNKAKEAYLKENKYHSSLSSVSEASNKPVYNGTSEIIFRGGTHEINTKNLGEAQTGIKVYNGARLINNTQYALIKRQNENIIALGSSERPVEVLKIEGPEFANVAIIKENIFFDAIEKICEMPIRDGYKDAYVYNNRVYEFDSGYRFLLEKVIKGYTKNSKDKKEMGKNDHKAKKGLVAAVLMCYIGVSAFIGLRSNNVNAAEKTENAMISVDNTIETSAYNSNAQKILVASNEVKKIGILPENTTYSLNSEGNSPDEKKVESSESDNSKKESNLESTANDETISDASDKEVLLETDEIVVTLDPSIEEGTVSNEGIAEDSNDNDKIDMDSSLNDETNSGSIEVDENDLESNPNDETDLDASDTEVLLETDEIVVTLDPSIEEGTVANVEIAAASNVDENLEKVDLQTKIENRLIINNYTKNDEELLNIATEESPNAPVAGYHLTYNNKTYPDMDEYALTKLAGVVWEEAKPGSYESSLEVSSIIANRLEDGGFAYAENPLEIVARDGQFAVWTSVKNSNTTLDQIPDYVLAAVVDCFYGGKRNNDYVYFKSANSSAKTTSGEVKVQIVVNGNKLHGLAQHLARFDYDLEDEYTPGL